MDEQDFRKPWGFQNLGGSRLVQGPLEVEVQRSLLAGTSSRALDGAWEGERYDGLELWIPKSVMLSHLLCPAHCSVWNHTGHLSSLGSLLPTLKMELAGDRAEDCVSYFVARLENLENMNTLRKQRIRLVTVRLTSVECCYAHWLEHFHVPVSFQLELAIALLRHEWKPFEPRGSSGVN